MDKERIEKAFNQKGLTRLIDRLQKYFERGMEGRQLLLPEARLEERKAVAAVLGRKVRKGNSIRISLADLEQAVKKAGLAPDLKTVIEIMRGPLKDVKRERETKKRQWDELFKELKETAPSEEARTMVEEVERDGLLRRLSKGEVPNAAKMMREAFSVISGLPGRGQALSVLAAETLGDAHALDPGKAVSTLVKRAIVRLDKAENSEGGEENEREIWARAGILVGGGITSKVLILNLPCEENSPTALVVREGAREGQPLWLTLRQLLRGAVKWTVENRAVYVCENPAIIAEAAEKLGKECPSMVCTWGKPGSAVHRILEELRNCGGQFYYHGDFDWDGLSIANGVMDRFGAQPWRMGRKDYLEAWEKGGKPLKGKPVVAKWDRELTSTMFDKNIAVSEEALLDILLGDLRKAHQEF